jgi:hypothetical protein
MRDIMEHCKDSINLRLQPNTEKSKFLSGEEAMISLLLL